jgi:hypothetical protein
MGLRSSHLQVHREADQKCGGIKCANCMAQNIIYGMDVIHSCI